MNYYSMKNHKLNIFGLDLEVTGTYYEGYYDDWDHPYTKDWVRPHTEDTFEIKTILIEGKVDVTEMFSSAYDKEQTYLIDRVEQEIINKYYI